MDLKMSQLHIIPAHCIELGNTLSGDMKEYTHSLYRNMMFRKHWKRQHTLETIERRSVLMFIYVYKVCLWILDVDFYFISIYSFSSLCSVLAKGIQALDCTVVTALGNGAFSINERLKRYASPKKRS